MLKLFVGLLPFLFASCGNIEAIDPQNSASKRDTLDSGSQIYLGDAEEQSKGTCVNSNIGLRSGAGFDFRLIQKIDLNKYSYTILSKDKSWVKIKINATNLVGYVFSEDICVEALIDDQFNSPGGNNSDLSSTDVTVQGAGAAVLSRKNVIDLSASFIGFSYWWGGAKLQVGASDKGKCKKINGKNDYNGHSGANGADCSGFAAKVWMLPAAMPLEKQSHPYSTSDFYNKTTVWTPVERKNIKQADALVYRSGTGGHIVIYDSGDNWNQIQTYESKGCAYGVVHQLRAISTAYKAIIRNSIQN